MWKNIAEIKKTHKCFVLFINISGFDSFQKSHMACIIDFTLNSLQRVQGASVKAKGTILVTLGTVRQMFACNYLLGNYLPAFLMLIFSIGKLVLFLSNFSRQTKH